MDLVVVWWPFAATGSSSGAECHLGLVWGHLTDLVVRAFFLYLYTYLFVHVCFFVYVSVSLCTCLVSSCLVLSRLVSSRRVSSCVLSVVVHGVPSAVSLRIAALSGKAND